MDKPTYAEDDVRLLKAKLPKPASRIWRFFLLVRIDSLLSALKIPRKLFSAYFFQWLWSDDTSRQAPLARERLVRNQIKILALVAAGPWI